MLCLVGITENFSVMAFKYTKLYNEDRDNRHTVTMCTSGRLRVSRLRINYFCDGIVNGPRCSNSVEIVTSRVDIGTVSSYEEMHQLIFSLSVCLLDIPSSK